MKIRNTGFTSLIILQGEVKYEEKLFLADVFVRHCLNQANIYGGVLVCDRMRCIGDRGGVLYIYCIYTVVS